MFTINLTFQNFIEKVKQIQPVSEEILYMGNSSTLKIYKISQITSTNACKIYQSIHLKFYKNLSSVKQKKWYENQLKMFVWILTYYLFLNNLKFKNLGKDDWKFFSLIFNNKDPKIFEYQCFKIFANYKRKTWEDQQEDIFKKIMQNYQINNKQSVRWSLVSRQLFQLSKKQYFRTSKQCREKWNNHLDPSKIKGLWKPEDCVFLFQYVRKHGRKWSSLAKAFKNTRNQHSIKNKFNSIYCKYTKLNQNQNQSQILQNIIFKIKRSILNKSEDDSDDESFDFSDKQIKNAKNISSIQFTQSDKNYNFLSNVINKQTLNQKYIRPMQNLEQFNFLPNTKCFDYKLYDQNKNNQQIFGYLNYNWNLLPQIAFLQPTMINQNYMMNIVNFPDVKNLSYNNQEM